MSDAEDATAVAHLATIKVALPDGLDRPWDDTCALRPAAESPSRTFTPEAEEEAAFQTLPSLSIARGAAERTERGALPDFSVESVLGEGGMGRVVLARQRSLRREVAIKSTRDDTDLHARAVLVSEAVITGSLEHPNIIPVHMLGRDGEGTPLLVMKRVQGTSWRALIDEPEHPFWAKSAYAASDRLVAHVDVLMQVCNALEYAHSRGIVHRDVKPENVLVGAYGEVYLVDWGIALRVDRAPSKELSRLVGTPAFMAPEMVDPERGVIDARTDVYLAGATLHYVLTGAGPHRAPTLAATLFQAWRSVPVSHPPEVPLELSAICRRAMRGEPQERFASARALRDALAEHLRHRGSARLAVEAEQRLTEATAAHTNAAKGTLLTEARFGFMQSLREWSENSAAREGLSRCLVAMLEQELAAENSVGARALFDALGEHSRREELSRRLGALDQTLAERREAEALGRRTEQERDLSIGSRGRVAVISAMICVAACIVCFFLYRRVHHHRIDMNDLVRLQGLALAVMVSVVFALRRRALNNAIGREILGTMIACTAVVFVHRVIARSEGVPVAYVLTVDAMFVTLTMLIAGLAIERAVLKLVPAACVGVVVMLVWPERVVSVYGLVIVLILLGSGLLWQRQAQK